MTTERLTAENFLKSKGIKDTLYNDNKWVKGGLSDLLEAFARQEVAPIEKQRDELLEACKSSFKTLAAIGCNMEAEIIKVLETAIKSVGA
jgi:hypothetical protein